MKKHPSKKDLTNAALRSNSSKDDYVFDHIMECNTCEKKYNAIQSLLQSSDNSSIIPSGHLETRVLKSYRKLNTDKESIQTLPFHSFRGFAKPLAYSFAALIIILFITLFYTTDKVADKYNTFPIALNSIKGRTIINDKQAKMNTMINQNSKIHTEKNSIAELYYEKLFSIRMAEKSTVGIKQSLINTELKAYRLAFILTEGDIYARFRHKKPGLVYSFRTPHAIINSIGTQFLLQVTNKETRLILTEGTLNIKSHASNKEVKASSDKKYIIAASIKVNAIDKGDKALINSLLNPQRKAGHITKDNKAKKTKKRFTPTKEKIRTRTKDQRKEFHTETKALRKSIKSGRKEMKANQKEIKNLKKSTKGFKR